MGTPLGVFLRHRRDQLGMDRKTLAELSGLSYPYISQLESSTDKRPSERALRLLAPALQLDLDQLLRVAEGWTSEGTSPPPSRRGSTSPIASAQRELAMMQMPTGMELERRDEVDPSARTAGAAAPQARDDVDAAMRELLPRLERRLAEWSPVARLAVLQELQAQALSELRRQP